MRRGQIEKGLLILLMIALLLIGCSSNTNNMAAENKGTSTSRDNASAGNASASDSGNRDSVSHETSEPAGNSSKGEHDDYGGDTAIGGGSNPEPQAGMLTAGEWNDAGQWDDWQSLLNSREGDSNQQYWSFYRFDRLTVMVTADNKPAADADVIVKNNRDETVWEAKTDISGKAYAYADLFRKKRSGGDYYVEVRQGSRKKRFENVEIPRDNILRVDFDKPSTLSNNVDLMFVVDTTGSMQDELDYLETELGDVIGRVQERDGQQLKIGVSTNFYRDTNDEYTVRTFPFTANVDKAVKQIGEQEAKGGGDYPEAVDEALADVLEQGGWSGEARARLLFLVLDAPPHHDGQIVDRLHGLAQKAAKQGIRIIPVASSGVDVETEYLMRFLAVSTGGSYVFLTDHSGIGSGHLEPAVGEYEVRALNDLLVDIIGRFT